ncbi:unnamed protein product [Ambrosiozyma monospora]|uniref:Unnamed protein product n=1 Tax=Ambrosiozyma monospora TaxID=43982 RepID=A0ACB5U0G6_AMBMO|nr:unnamed protein product [Ambrosiozyma monospora]
MNPKIQSPRHALQERLSNVNQTLIKTVLCLDWASNEQRLRQINKTWPHLPFQALPDGAHLFDEVFTNFTLVYDDATQTCPELPFEAPQKDATSDPSSGANSNRTSKSQESLDPNSEVVTLFGCACLRQLNSDQLTNETDLQDVKRSVVQKSIVLITRYPLTIQLKEKLSIITTTYFEQLDFEDKSIIEALYQNLSWVYNKDGYKVEDDDLYESLAIPKKDGFESNEKIIRESDFYTALNLKQIVLKLRKNLLILFKALLLEKRILIFSKDLNKLSNLQIGVEFYGTSIEHF